MKKWIALGGITLVILFTAITVTKKYNGWIGVENQIYAKQEVIGNTLTTFMNKAATSMGIAKTQADMVIKGIEAANKSRYGGGGSKGAMQWIKEQNPNMPKELFIKVQNAVEAGYAKVEAEQNENIDIIREYKTSLEMFPGNLFASLLGFPSKWNTQELAKLSQPIMNKQSTEVMKTKQMEALKL